MTEQGKPFSRRARRARDARAAGISTEAIEAMGSEELSQVEPPADTQGLSRRDRRRLERSQRPMETWTAEEEMIATGQLPAMTPAVIAEQERIAQEKAQQAAAEAAAASAQFGVTPGPSALAAAGLDANADPGVDSSADDAADATAPVRPSAFARVAEASQDPSGDLPAPHDDEAPSAEPEPDVVPEPEPEPGVAPEPEPEPDVAPEAEPQPRGEAEPESASGSVAQGEPEGVPDAYGDIPEAFRGMFPPGSLQARAFAERRQAEEDGAGGEPAEESVADDSEPAAHHEDFDPIDEIRRLTAAAMAGIEGASHHGTSGEAQQPDTSPWSEPAPESDTAPAAESVAESDTAPAAEPVAEPAPELDAESVPELDTESVTEPQVPETYETHEAESPLPYAPAPHQASFDEVIATRSGEVPLVEQRVDLSASATSASSPAPASGELPVVEPSVWDAHPLTATQAQSRELADAPSQAIPRPDFSTLAPTPNPAHPAPFPPEGYMNAEPGLKTGSIEVARRRIPELHPAGGARHFRWAHIAVIGAIAFVLGVLVWNLAGQG